jgi:hypothetical protein
VTGVRDISGSLARQSLLVAGVCLTADTGLFLIAGPPLSHGWPVWLILAATIAADAGLAAPTRFSGWVALGHAVLVATAPLILPAGSGVRVPDNAGVLIAGYRAGAWLRTPQALLALAALVGGLITCQFAAHSRASGDWRLIVINVLTTGLLPWLVGRYTTAAARTSPSWRRRPNAAGMTSRKPSSTRSPRNAAPSRGTCTT